MDPGPQNNLVELISMTVSHGVKESEKRLNKMRVQAGMVHWKTFVFLGCGPHRSLCLKSLASSHTLGENPHSVSRAGGQQPGSPFCGLKRRNDPHGDAPTGMPMAGPTDPQLCSIGVTVKLKQ